MIKSQLLKIRPTYIFNLLAIALIVIFLLLNSMYQQTREDIVAINHKANIDYVSSLSKTLSIDISRILKRDFYSSLEEDFIAREYIESNLALFVTSKYQYIYLIAKEESKSERFLYLTNTNFDVTYNPIHREKYEEVYRIKKAIYFKESKEELASYLSPIVVNDKVEAIIVIKFSLQEKDTILLALKELGAIFEMFFGFFVLMFIFIFWLSYVDKRREDDKKIVFDKLQESNTNLHSLTTQLQVKSNKISEMNNTLEERVQEEVSKNRAKDAQLIHQARLAQMGEMISMIAHQWRQPLNAITATSSSIKLKAELNKLDTVETEKLADNISEYAQHLSTTIDDFRNFFKPNKDKIMTDYNYIIKSVQSIIETSLDSKNIKIIKELECSDSFESYPNELKQVVLNLVKNAEDALLEAKVRESYIKITTYSNEEGLVLEICDNAGGIPQDIIDKIFDPYFSTKLEKDGTGLGLYMSKMIIEEHCNGSLSVKNSENGAEFKIVLGKV